MAEQRDNWADQVKLEDELKIDLGDENQPNTPHKQEVEKRRSRGRPAKKLTTKKNGTEDELSILHPHDVNGDNDNDSVVSLTVELEKAEDEANVLRKANNNLTEELKSITNKFKKLETEKRVADNEISKRKVLEARLKSLQDEQAVLLQDLSDVKVLLNEEKETNANNIMELDCNTNSSNDDSIVIPGELKMNVLYVNKHYEVAIKNIKRSDIDGHTCDNVGSITGLLTAATDDSYIETLSGYPVMVMMIGFKEEEDTVNG